MALIEQTLFGKVDKVKIAIDRIKSFEPISNGFMDEPYYVAYSGGKDSDCLRILFELAGVPYDLVHNHTTVDAPETVYYIRTIPKIQIIKPEITMWDLIVKNRMPPTRLARYCCSQLKERGGLGRFVSTGVRWAESVNRKKKRGGLEIQGSKAVNNIILNADNDESRRLFETCQIKGKRILNPIIDWSDNDVWELLGYYGCKSNPLYECGYKRVGCVGCPMNTRVKQEFERCPKYRQSYIHAFDRMITRNLADGFEMPTWKTGQDVFDWWVDRRKKIPAQLENQIVMLGMTENLMLNFSSSVFE